MKIFGGGGGRSGNTFKTPSPYEQLLSLLTPYFKFLERSLNNPPPPPHFKHLSLLAPPHPPLLPLSQKILIIHKTNIFRLCKSRVAKSLKTNHVQRYAGINLTGYHPPRAPRGFCTEMCAQPQGFCTTENARGLGQ